MVARFDFRSVGSPEGAIIGTIGDTCVDVVTGTRYNKTANSGQSTGWTVPSAAVGADSVGGNEMKIRWTDHLVPLITANVGGTITPPEFVIFRDGVGAYRFRNTRDDDVSFTAQFKHEWVPGIIQPHIHWSAGVNGVAQAGKKVRWKMELTWASIGTVFPNTQILTFEDTITGQDYFHEITGSDIDPDLSACNVSVNLICRVWRDNTVLNNAPVGIFATDSDFHIQVKGIGTVNTDGSGGK